MRLTKMLGLAAIAALAAMAFAGAGTATAEEKTVLCKANEKPCAEANIYPAGTKIKAEAQEPKLQANSPFGNVEVICERSDVSGETSELQGQQEGQLRGQITALSFTQKDGVTKKCKDTLAPAAKRCEVQAVQLPYQVHLSQEPKQLVVNEKFVNGAQTGQPGWQMICQDADIFTPDIRCTFKVNEEDAQAANDHKAKGGVEAGFRVARLHVTQEGAEPIVKTGQAAPLQQKVNLKVENQPDGGKNCGNIEEPKWEAEYKVSEPTPMWVSQIVKP